MTHEHGTGCVNTYPDCDYPDLCNYYAGETSHCLRPAEPGKRHCKKHVARAPATCTMECGSVTQRPGQPCAPCDRELGAG